MVQPVKNLPEKVTIDKADFLELLETLRLYNEEDETAIYEEPERKENNQYWIDIGTRGARILSKFGIEPHNPFEMEEKPWKDKKARAFHNKIKKLDMPHQDLSKVSLDEMNRDSLSRRDNSFYEDRLVLEVYNPAKICRLWYLMDIELRTKVKAILDGAKPSYFPKMLDPRVELPYWAKLRYVACHVSNYQEEDRMVIHQSYQYLYSDPLTPAQTEAYRLLQKHSKGKGLERELLLLT